MSDDNGYKTTGVIRAIEDEKTRGKYTTRQVVLTTEPGKYEQTPVFEFFGDKALGQIDGLRIGDTVTFWWNLKGREWVDKDTKAHKGWFTTLSVWKAELVNGKPRGPVPGSSGGNYGAPPDDDIPFIDCAIESELIGIARLLRGQP